MTQDLNDNQRKQDVLDEITGLLGMERQSVGVGLSLPSEVFEEAARQADVPYLSMPDTCEAIVEKAGLRYDARAYDSRQTPSGGGSTVTLEGLKAMKQALEKLL